jgi:hypothetical protein
MVSKDSNHVSHSEHTLQDVFVLHEMIAKIIFLKSTDPLIGIYTDELDLQSSTQHSKSGFLFGGSQGLDCSGINVQYYQSSQPYWWSSRRTGANKKWFPCVSINNDPLYWHSYHPSERPVTPTIVSSNAFRHPSWVVPFLYVAAHLASQLCAVPKAS